MSDRLAFADPAAARRAAAAILQEGRFHSTAVPRPLHSLLHDLGTLLTAPAHALTRLAALLGTALPGGEVTGWIVLGALLAAAAWFVAHRYSRAALIRADSARRGELPQLSAAALERQAVQAEAEGRFADAIRLRFRAGLRRLAQRGTVAGTDSTPTREIARSLGSPAFDGLARQFDAIAYGSAPAQASDAERARAAWRAVLADGRDR